MNILFISYWGIHEGLSSATVIPHVKMLSSFPAVKKIVLCSIERVGPIAPIDLGEKITHVPLMSDGRGVVLLTKARDFFVFPRALIKLCAVHDIDFILCRSSLAGALGHLVHRKTSIPYAVESFEPHADYMIETGIWNRFDPRSLIQRYFENKIRRSAQALLPVSFHYRDALVKQGVLAEKIIVQPCCVDLDHFSYSVALRKKIRQQNGIPSDATVATYVGKFGHMYYDVEAFKLYSDAFRFFGENFYLIILSADDPQIINGYIRQFQLPNNRIVFKKASPEEVPLYLSAADFAFATFRWAPSKQFLSPIKNAEYWANGLPILLEPGIGDDSDIIQQEEGGVILDMKNPEIAFAGVQKMIAVGRDIVTARISKIAFRHRRMGLIKDSYERLLGK